MPKADIATLSPILLTVGLLLPAFMSKSLSDQPLDIFMIGIPLKLLASVLLGAYGTNKKKNWVPTAQ